MKLLKIILTPIVFAAMIFIMFWVVPNIMGLIGKLVYFTCPRLQLNDITAASELWEFMPIGLIAVVSLIPIGMLVAMAYSIIDETFKKLKR